MLTIDHIDHEPIGTRPTGAQWDAQAQAKATFERRLLAAARDSLERDLVQAFDAGECAWDGDTLVWTGKRRQF